MVLVSVVGVDWDCCVVCVVFVVFIVLGCCSGRWIVFLGVVCGVTVGFAGVLFVSYVLCVWLWCCDIVVVAGVFVCYGCCCVGVLRVCCVMFVSFVVLVR